MNREQPEKGSKIKLRLRTKFMAGILALELVLMVTVILVVERQMRNSVLDEFLKRAHSISRNIASVNTNYLATYNFVGIDQNMKQVTGENDLLYAAVLFYDGELASYVGPAENREAVLSGPIQEKTRGIGETLVQYGRFHNASFCDIAVPVFLDGENWGTVRCGFSLKVIDEAILKTRKLLLLLACIGLVFGCLSALLLARRITRPIGLLVNGAEAVATGNFDHPIRINTSDEIAYLAGRFSFMQQMIKENMAALENAREAAEAANIAKSQFLTNVSHETLTPLHGLLGMAGILRQTPLSEKQHKLLCTLQQSGEGLLSVVNSILDFSRIESGNFHLIKKPFNPLSVIESTAMFISESARNKGLRTACRTPHDLPVHLYGDPDRLRQLLTIIMGNAVKFTEKGEVRLEVALTFADRSCAVIRFDVIDTGIGISPDVREHIFDTFSQADASLTRNHEGLGLGLSIARHLTDKMEGGIEIMEAPEQGTCVRVTTRFEKPTPKSDHPEDISHLSIIRAMVVDTHEAGRTILGYHLSSWGARFSAAESMEEALGEIRNAAWGEDPFGVLFVDLEAPGSDMAGLSRILKSDPATAGVIPVAIVPFGVHEVEKHPELSEIPHCLARPVLQSRLLECLTSLTTPYELSEGPDMSVEGPETKVFDSHVLIVEDNPVNRALLNAYLKGIGCTTDTVQNGLEAVSAFSEKEYDIIAMDCQMPVMDGYEATRSIREIEASRKRPHVPILAVTAHAMDGDRERCLDCGMDDYLTKPFTVEQLITTLKRLLPSIAPPT